ncbi:S-layer homology domain-containing protein [Sporosarcina gallistercoris]|uniref:S-layer homology domain-containing protein n=1 Tax=Sporosarcina gallistercoris TaxID=2762245 RepID=A0ABR8PMT2_9BACL|nr:S-layer homology domain-containing protein [Sporosarcina gallistercoris]MBD7909399.1 S-layer homology domain-containing protein [Sporosarcina gallistercoris]
MKRFISGIAALALGLGLAVQPAAAASKFTDVTKTNQFQDEIQYLTGKKIISGFSNGTFKPKAEVTRGDAAIMIGRLKNLDGTKRPSKFKDVNKDSAASGYITSAVAKGYITGYADGTFRPNEILTRGDMAIILTRALDLRLGSMQSFSDVSDRMKASEAIYNIAGEFITGGYADGTFRPYDKVTREQFSAFLARALSPVYKQRTVNNDGFTYDMTKKYVFNVSGEELHVSYKNTSAKFGDLTYKGFFWEYKNTTTNKTQYVRYEQTKDAVYLEYPFSDANTELKLPVKVGKKWNPALSEEEFHTITGIGKTITTPYKKFTDAIEVTTETGNKKYFVKNIGQVKTVDKSGKVLSELKSIQ